MRALHLVILMCKVSVIIPAYNVEKFIERTVASILRQSLQEIEIIVVNDGSQDGTLNILKSIQDKRLAIVNQRNHGVSAARNTGIDQAKGEYLFFLDGDDWLEPESLSEMYGLAETEQVEIVLSDYYVDDDKGHMQYIDTNNLISEDYLKEALLNRVQVSVWGKLYKASLFKDNQISFPEDISIGEDLYVNTLCFYFATKVRSIKKPYIHYIQRSDSMIATYNEKMLDIFKVFDLLKAFLEQKWILEKYQEEFIYFRFLHIYLSRAVFVPQKGLKIHRKIFKREKEQRKKYLSNQYVLTYLNSTRPLKKIKIQLLHFNYFLAIALESILNFKR